ncbi:MAG: hypothetical protein JOZ96_03800 [Acidobacteria bacterium]|nr:hypothetical protein [Acidobacteriota bacterium]
MKFKLHTNLGRALAACLLAALTASAQEPAEKLSLRLVLYEGATPLYYDVGEKGFSSGGEGLTNSFRRLKAAPAAQRGERLRGMNLNVMRRGNRVIVKLWLTREIDEALVLTELGAHEVGVGDEWRVEALEQYGYEPVRLGLVRRAPIKFSAPPVVNLTRSITVLGVEALQDEPEFEVTLKNTSDRNLMGVELRLTKDGEIRGARPESSFDGKPLALPGAIWKTKLKIAGTPDGASPEGHRFEEPDEIVVASALFSGGGYEGDVMSVATGAAVKLGHKLQAGHALAIVRGWKEQEGVSLTDAAKEWQRQARALPRAADDALVDEFMAKFPELPAFERERMKGYIESGLKAVRTELLSGLKSFVEGGNAQFGPPQFAGWLSQMRVGYERILAN